jgi:hypothetical protein
VKVPAKTALATVPRNKPALYTPWLGAEICAGLAEGRTLRQICRSSSMPHYSTVLGWVDDDIDGFRRRYHEARRHGAEQLFEQMLEVAANTSEDAEIRLDNKGMPYAAINGFAIARAKLIIDTMRYSLAKLYPRKYGELSEKIAEREEEQARQEVAVDVLPVMPSITREEWMRLYGPRVEVVPLGK